MTGRVEGARHLVALGAERFVASVGEGLRQRPVRAAVTGAAPLDAARMTAGAGAADADRPALVVAPVAGAARLEVIAR